MDKGLTKLSCVILYLDEAFRNNREITDEDRSLDPIYGISEKMLEYSESPNLRVVEIFNTIETDLVDPDNNERLFSTIQETIGSFDDEATLIFISHSTLLESKFADINMYIYSNIDKLSAIYVYENAAGSWLLDKVAEEKENSNG